jgi:hypothetical protein
MQDNLPNDMRVPRYQKINAVLEVIIKIWETRSGRLIVYNEASYNLWPLLGAKKG